MAHVAASLSARPVLHHRFADTGVASERRKDAVEGRKHEARGATTREITRRGKRKAASERLRRSRETNLLASLPTNGAHILISTRSPSYYWLEINRPFRG